MNEFAIARRMRILASNAYLPTSMWVLLLVGAAATAFLSAVIIYGVVLVGMLEYPFGGGVHVTATPFEELLKVFEQRATTQ